MVISYYRPLILPTFVSSILFVMLICPQHTLDEILSTLNGLSMIPSFINNINDKVAHLSLFFLATILILSCKKSYTYYLICLFILAILLEFAQLIIPSRNFSFLDIVANLLGIVVGYIVTKIYTFFCKSFILNKK